MLRHRIGPLSDQGRTSAVIGPVFNVLLFLMINYVIYYCVGSVLIYAGIYNLTFKNAGSEKGIKKIVLCEFCIQTKK